MSTTIRVSTEAKMKFAGIRKKNPQFNTDAEVFDHIIYIYEEQQFKPGRSVHDDAVIAEIKKKQLAPTKNNTFQIVKSDK